LEEKKRADKQTRITDSRARRCLINLRKWNRYVAGIMDLLLRFFCGDRCRGHLILLQGDFLINGVDVSRWWSMDGSFLVFFDDGDVRVLMLVLALTFDGAIGDDNENPEHPKENTDTTAKDKCYGSTLPATQMHQSMVEAGGEGTIATTEAVVMKTVVAVVRREFGRGEQSDASGHCKGDL